MNLVIQKELSFMETGQIAGNDYPISKTFTTHPSICSKRLETHNEVISK